MKNRFTAGTTRFALMISMTVVCVVCPPLSPVYASASPRPQGPVQAAPVINAIAPTESARPMLMKPSTPQKPQGRVVYPLRTIDPVALAAAKQKANKKQSTSGPHVATTTPATGVFNNTNQSGISAADEGACCTPPDTTGSIGPGNYVETVNNLVRVYDRSLNRISDMDLGTFTGTPTGLNTSDPQMQWDAQGNRWLYAAVAFATGNNYLLLGWSKTADPIDLAAGWCHFGLYTANLLQDYPKLGHDDNYILVGTNAYDDSKSGFPFVSATIWALPKPATGDASCAVGTSSHFGDATHLLINADGSPAFTPVPANTADSSSTGYIVAAHSPMNAPAGPQNKVMVWHMVKGGSGPQLVQDGDLAVQSFNIPPAIPQPGPSLDSLDARLTQAVAHRDPDAGNAEAIWTQHTIVSTTSRSVVRWYELVPSQLRVRQQGELSSATDYIFNGAISPSTLGNDAGLFYDRASSSLTPVIGAVSRTHGDPLSTMGSELLIGTSAAADSDLSCRAPYGPPCRWGDYSSATPDPSAAGIVWGANQVSGPTFFGYPQWATRIFAVQATSAPDFSLSISPTGRALTPPGSTTYTVAIAAQGGFSGTVTLSSSGLPSGTTAAFSPNPATTSATLTLTTAASTPAATSQFTVSGASGSLAHNVQGTLVTTAASSYAATVMADAPNAYWRLGETSGTLMVDSTANANNGTYAGGFSLNQPGAIVGDGNAAVSLDGSTGNGRGPNSPTLNLTGAVSVEAWVDWSAVATTSQNIINKGDGATAAGTAFHLAYVTGCTGCGLGFYTFKGNTFICACQANAPPAGQWLHLVGTRATNGQINFYVNGSLVATNNDGGGALNSVPSGIGVGASGAGTATLNGSIDESAIYPAALTAAQVSAHFQASGNANPPGAPTNVTATAGVNQAMVSWAAPAGNITGYLATAYAGSSAKNSVALDRAGSSATIYGLQGGTTYTIQVRARNAIGTGPAGISNTVMPTGSASTYASTVLGDGPVLYYRLSDPSGNVAADSSNSGNAGAYAGGITQNVSGGLGGDPDGAVLLDGNSGNVRAGNSSSLSQTGAVSVEIWVKWMATPSGTQDLINKGDGGTATGTAYMLGYVPGCAGCGLGFYSFIGSGFTCACQGNAPTAGQWYHLVGTRTAGGQLAFYVNGALVASASDGGGAMNNVPSGVGIGASGSGSGGSLYPANATLDEAAVYPTALTAAQVSNHMQAAGGPPAAPTNVSATAGSNQATVNWTAPGGNISGYLVTAYAGTSPRNSIALGGASTSVTISGLQGGTTYTVQVKAANSQGSGPAGASNVVTPTGTASTYASTVIADGPALYYRLDDRSGTAADSSGNSVQGAYAGGNTQTVAGALPSDPDGAVLLDGSSGNVRAPNSSSINLTGAISVEVWVKWTATATTTQDLVNKGDGATATGTAYMLGYVPGCSGCGLGFYTFIGNNFVCACQSSALGAGPWFHLVGTRTAAGQLALYINGSLAATASDGGGAMNTVPAALGIGATGSGNGSSLYPANATLDEAAVYPLALTAAQVSAHYHAGGY